MNIYCKSCGSPTAYGSKKPKFCSHCGTPFGSEAKASSAPKTQPKPKKQVIRQEIIEDDDYEQDSVSIPNISRLEADIDSGRNSGVKLGQIAGTATSEDDAFIRPSDGSETTPEEALKQLKREGGSIREK